MDKLNHMAALLQRKLANTALGAPASNPADYLNGTGNGTFSKLTETLKSTLADAYAMLIAVGIGVVGCALVAAFIMFGVLKDTSAVKENKQWILRLLIAVIGIASVLTLIGIASGIGNAIQ